MTEVIETLNEYEVDEHTKLCREYSKRKRALLENFPLLSGQDLEKAIQRIAREVGI